MKDNYIEFKDAAQGIISITDNAEAHLDFNDGKIKAGQKLVANIEMTHAGIVTRNLGFYLPANMKKGASTFQEHFNKPVIIGHDDNADPVGRVVDAKYVDTSHEYRMNDKYLSSLMGFNDAVEKKAAKWDEEAVVDFAQHIMTEYWGKDTYRGLGHIQGTVEISDPDTIQKIIDQRYLTVSTSMTSDAVSCSECGQNWVEEGMCDHRRGKVYDSGIPMVLIPTGNMKYNHLGIVTEPADVFAAGFSNIKLVKDGKSSKVSDSFISKELEDKFEDKFGYAANLFSWDDNKLVSLSSNQRIDLIEVKNDIQKIEDSLKTEKRMSKKTELTLEDRVSAVINLYTSGEDENGEYSSSEVTVRKHAAEMGEAQIKELASKAMAALDSKTFETDEDFKDAVFKILLEDAESANQEQEEETKEMKNIKVLDSKFKLIDGETQYDLSKVNDAVEAIGKIEDHGLGKKEIKELANAIVRAPLKDALFFNYNIDETAELESIVKDFAKNLLCSLQNL